MSNCIPNTNPDLELVEVQGTVVTTRRIVAWHVGAHSATPITLGGYGERWCVHDRATGRAEVPGEYSGMLHDALRHLGLVETPTQPHRNQVVPNTNPQLELVEVVFDKGTGRVATIRTPVVGWSVEFVEGGNHIVRPHALTSTAHKQWFIHDRTTGQAWNASMGGTFADVLHRCTLEIM